MKAARSLIVVLVYGIYQAIPVGVLTVDRVVLQLNTPAAALSTHDCPNDLINCQDGY